MTNYYFERWGVTTGREASQQVPVWLLDELVEQGDQWIVSGAPKTGKSLLAIEIALAVASGGKFLNWENTTPAKVLYMDFELKDRLFWKRFFTMADSCNVTDEEIKPYFFRCGDFKTTDVLDPNEAQKMVDTVNEIQPDFIVWDVLARMHNASENDNAEMGRVMRAIRDISGSAAHVVVHHAKKSGYESGGYNPGAAGMRGASSIHGEADGVIALAVLGGQGARYSLKFSSRAVETPDEVLLDRDEHLMLLDATVEVQDRLMVALQEALKGRTSIPATELTDCLSHSFTVKRRRAQEYMKACVDKGWLKRKKNDDKTYEYHLQDAFSALNVMLPQQDVSGVNASMQ